MTRLSDDVKRRIVELLACYFTHNEVVDLIREEFGITLTPRHVRAYDPMCFQFAASERLRQYHGIVRKRFESEVADIAISHRAYRLRKLDEIHKEAMAAGNFKEAREALEQAAKEVGNVYTNIQRTSGSTNNYLHLHQHQRTPEESRNMLVDRIAEALARLPPEEDDGVTIEQKVEEAGG